MSTTVPPTGPRVFNANKPTLFWSKVCPYVHRAWMVAVEKNVDLDLHFVPLDDSHPEWQWYAREINPRETVPCLRLPCGRILQESMLVSQYLDDNYGPIKGSLQSGSSIQKYHVRRFVEAASAATNDFYVLLAANKGPDDVKQAKAAADARLDGLERLYAAQSTNGPYFLGDTFGIADISVLPFLDRFRHTLPAYRGVSLLTPEAHPRLTKLLKTAESRPSFALTAQPADFYIDYYKTTANSPILVTPAGKLYYNRDCVFCERVLLANLLKSSPLELVHVELPNGEAPEWYKKEVNPSGLVPVIVLPSGTAAPASTLAESLPLVFFVDEVSGSGNDLSNALVAGNTLQPLTSQGTYETRFLLSEFEQSTESMWSAFHGDAEAGRQTLQNLGHLNSYYAAQTGPYFLGQKPTLADCVLLPFWARIEGVYTLTLSKLPEAEGQTFGERFPKLSQTVEAARGDSLFSTVIKSKEYFLEYAAKKLE